MSDLFSNGIPIEGSGTFNDIFVNDPIVSPTLGDYTYSLWVVGDIGEVATNNSKLPIVEQQYDSPIVNNGIESESQLAATTAKFGDVPTTDVITAAGNNISGTGVSTNNLAAMMLSVTWAETTGDRTLTPSPMTIGRADTGYPNLYAFQNTSPSGPYARAFWNAGIGVFQLDSSGLGSNLAMHNMVLTNTASDVVAAAMASSYKSATGTAVQKRRAAWSPWFGCGSSAVNCENNYNAIYSSSTDVISLSRDSSVARGGGLVSKTCYNTANPGTTWACYKWNATVAQGHTASWYYAPYNGSSSILPVPLPFYTYSATVGSSTVEYRHWLSVDTGYSSSIYANRTFGTNARTSLAWHDLSPLGAS